MTTDPQPPPPVAASALPMRTALLASLSTHQSLLTTLLQSLPSSPSSIPPIHAALLDASAHLAALSTEVDAHQAAWARAVSKSAEVARLEDQVRRSVGRVERGRREVEYLVTKGKKTLESVDKSESKPLSVPLLLAHAHALARTTSAPAPGERDKAQSAPWPGEAAMRMGLLFQLEGSMSGVGDVGVVADEEEKEERRRADIVEESARRYDPNAVFQLELNSDDSDED